MRSPFMCLLAFQTEHRNPQHDLLCFYNPLKESSQHFKPFQKLFIIKHVKYLNKFSSPV